jgi:hypothetical protein
LCFHTNFRTVFYVCEEYHWNFDADCIESIDLFQYLAVFTISIMSIHEYRGSFQLYCLFFISFFIVL